MEKGKKKSKRRNRKCSRDTKKPPAVSQCAVCRNIKPTTDKLDRDKSETCTTSTIESNLEQNVSPRTQSQTSSTKSGAERTSLCAEIKQDSILNSPPTKDINSLSCKNSSEIDVRVKNSKEKDPSVSSEHSGSNNLLMNARVNIDLDINKMTTIKASKSNFKLNPEAAVFAPSKKPLNDTSSNSATAAPIDEKNERDKEKETEQKIKSKAERKALFEAQRAKEKSQTNVTTEVKSKAELRAERRALQEAQRAAKGESKVKVESTINQQDTNTTQPPTKTTIDVNRKEENVSVVQSKEIVRSNLSASSSVISRGRKVQFFSHLQQYKADLPLIKDSPFASDNLHPAFIRLGLQLASGAVTGSNARCVAFLRALKQLIIDYVTPSNKELSRDLEDKVKPHLKFLQECRPISVSMENAIWYFKRQLAQLNDGISDLNAKQTLVSAIENYINENVFMADEAIANFALKKIKDDDVILIFAHSSVVNAVLRKAHSKQIRFRVVIVDSRPKMEGLKTMSFLVNHGIDCTYTLINALSYTMQKVTKVFLGAHALLANGYVVSRVGSAQVALMAKAFNVPVLICCETHKFSERLQTDSFVSNELGNPDDLVVANSCALFNWRQSATLDLLHLLYDVTPPDLVSAVVTELGLLPCTSVPVVLRLKRG